MYLTLLMIDFVQGQLYFNDFTVYNHSYIFKFISVLFSLNIFPDAHFPVDHGLRYRFGISKVGWDVCFFMAVCL